MLWEWTANCNLLEPLNDGTHLGVGGVLLAKTLTCRDVTFFATDRLELL